MTALRVFLNIPSEKKPPCVGTFEMGRPRFEGKNKFIVAVPGAQITLTVMKRVKYAMLSSMARLAVGAGDHPGLEEVIVVDPKDYENLFDHDGFTPA